MIHKSLSCLSKYINGRFTAIQCIDNLVMAIKSYWCTNDTNSSVKSKHVLSLISFSILTRIFPAQI